ncbi:hypothetical protein J3R30DRAFT_3403824 [Lentinula aciculospora]|uniref:Alcohol dehydrogenase-like N-terminal domain-containing protein n=1 Tax=Lentinula aciculospora TaxID=153920 RepID=A0A9W9ABJ4_9AGAR|nr:hypothetical protein J3R30DRAFT_3403824 [Lentinula aciculospora]
MTRNASTTLSPSRLSPTIPAASRNQDVRAYYRETLYSLQILLELGPLPFRLSATSLNPEVMTWPFPGGIVSVSSTYVPSLNLSEDSQLIPRKKFKAVWAYHQHSIQSYVIIHDGEVSRLKFYGENPGYADEMVIYSQRACLQQIHRNIVVPYGAWSRAAIFKARRMFQHAFQHNQIYTMSKEVKAWGASSPKKTESITITRRAPDDEDVAIDIKFAVFGHEIAGVINAVGQNVTKFKVGDHVGQYCLSGAVLTYSSKDPNDGTITQGGYSNIPLEKAAPLMCADITLYSPLNHSNAGPGKRAGIVGFGGLGHMGVKLANKKELALRLGADNYIATNETDVFSKLSRKFDLIINAVSAKTQQMLDFCGEKQIFLEIETIPASYINEAYERVLKSQTLGRLPTDLIYGNAELLALDLKAVAGIQLCLKRVEAPLHFVLSHDSFTSYARFQVMYSTWLR